MGQDKFFDPRQNVKEQREFLHDLSNPLSIAMGMTEITLEKLKKQDSVDPKALECLEKSLKAIHRMKDLLVKRREILIEKTPEDKAA